MVRSILLIFSLGGPIMTYGAYREILWFLQRFIKYFWNKYTTSKFCLNTFWIVIQRIKLCKSYEGWVWKEFDRLTPRKYFLWKLKFHFSVFKILGREECFAPHLEFFIWTEVPQVFRTFFEFFWKWCEALFLFFA